jgi:hypothetical protein
MPGSQSRASAFLGDAMIRSAVFTAIALALALPAAAASRPDAEAGTAGSGAAWVLQLGTGSALQLRSRLVVEQDGEADLDFTARYETRPYTSGAPYYTLRLGRWAGNAAWEVETHHHLVTLVDGPPQIGGFSLTHGYNLNTLNRAWLAGGFVWRLGAGIVITHPESIVRNRKFAGRGFAEGFYLSGACAQAALEKRVPLGSRIFLSLEGKLTAAWARVPVAGGEATVPNYAVHGIAGVGYTF